MTELQGALLGIVIVFTWIMGLALLWYFYLNVSDNTVNITRYQKLMRKVHKTKPQRLCGYHLTLEFRYSSLAIVDGSNCEICKREIKNKEKE